MPSVRAAAVQPGAERAGPRGDELSAGRLAVHRAAEHVVRGGDAGDVRAVRPGDDADVDVVGRADRPGVDGERHGLDDVGRRVVGAERADLAVLAVRTADDLVGEVLVHVEVDDDVLGRRGVQDAPDVGPVAVAVDVAEHLAAGDVRRRLREAREPPGAGGRGRSRPGRRRSCAARCRHPRAATVAVKRVDDLAFAGGRLLQRGVRQVDAAVEDADGGAPAVPGRVLALEDDGARLPRRHEGVVVRRRRAGAAGDRRLLRAGLVGTSPQAGARPRRGRAPRPTAAPRSARPFRSARPR